MHNPGSGNQAAGVLRLKKREERRILAGHLWVFSNEIDIQATPLKSFDAGAPAVLESASGKFLAHVYVNPASLICARITSRVKPKPFNVELLEQRLLYALGLRERRYGLPYYRWVHGEGDYLPGLVVDRYNDVVVAQITTAGMEVYKDDIADLIVKIAGVSSVCFRNDVPIRELEQLPLYREWVAGTDPGLLKVEENGLSFTVPTELGQKTGWFYDHRESRFSVREWSKGKRVLDLYSYIGGFGLNAAKAGASEVMAIDASAGAVEAANDNAKANGLSDNFRALAADAVEHMRELAQQSAQFDVVILDPPAFIKRKKDRDAGMRHYALNNRLAMKLLAPGGILLSASCSQALDLSQLQQVLRQGMPKSAESLQQLQMFQQAPDHPANLAMPETLYLKGVIARLL